MCTETVSSARKRGGQKEVTRRSGWRIEGTLRERVKNPRHLGLGKENKLNEHTV